MIISKSIHVAADGIISFFFFKIIYLFLVALGLCCCLQAFSSGGEHVPLFVVVCRLSVVAVLFFLFSTDSRLTGFSSCSTEAQLLWLTDSRIQAEWLWCTGPVALQHVDSSQTRDRTHVPCSDRQIFIHCASREVLVHSFFWLSNTPLCTGTISSLSIHLSVNT